jgi:YfiH family protein
MTGPSAISARLGSRPLGPGARALFTTRSGGVSSGSFRTFNLGYQKGDEDAAVAANRNVLVKAIEDGPARVAWMRQVHGVDVALVDGEPAVAVAGEPALEPEVDALVTGLPGVGLAVLVADCAPVLAADPVAGLVGAAHVGRTGLVAGVVPALLKAMMGAGAAPGSMHVLVGPSVCGRCYEVPAVMRDEVELAAPGAACVTAKGTAGIDIRAGLHGQLAALGVGAVTDDLRCTVQSSELYSYRRDGRTGRFAGLVWLTR